MFLYYREFENSPADNTTIVAVARIGYQTGRSRKQFRRDSVSNFATEEVTIRPTRITYDPDGDVLYVNFGQPTASTGYQLSDQILLRVDPKAETASGLTIFNYSLHASAAREIPLPADPRTGGRKSVAFEHSWFRACQTISHRRYARGGIFANLLSPSLQQAVGG